MKVLLIFAATLLLLSVSQAGPDDKKDDKDHKGRSEKDGHDGKENEGPSKELELDQTRVKVSGKSGKIRLWKEYEGRKNGSQTNETESKSTAPVFVFFEELLEIGKGGKAIPGERGAKHSFKSFASQSFEFSDVTEGSIHPSNVQAKYFEYGGQLSGLTSTMTTRVYVVGADGEVDLGGEKTSVYRGEVKFSVNLTAWEWCDAGTCDGEDGEYIDLVMAIGVPKGRKVKAQATRPRKFDLGEKAFIDFSTKVNIDGVWMDMPSGYPRYEEKGKKMLFTLRFPRFNTTALYDPYADSGTTYLTPGDLPDTSTYDPNPDGDNTSSATIGVASVATLLMTLVLVSL